MQARLGQAYTSVANFASVINVRAYGATGDGVTDDTAAINAAVVALGTALSTVGNAQLVFPQGTYMTDGVVVSSLTGFTISGPGKLKLNRARVGNVTANTNDVLAFINCTNFTVDLLEIDGNRHIDVTWPTADRAPVTQYIQSNAASGQKNVVVADGTKFVVGERVWVCGGLTVNGGVEKDFVDNNGQAGIAIDAIVGNTLTLHTNLTHTYAATGAAGAAYVTTYNTGSGNTVGIYTLGNEDQQNGIHLIGCSQFIIARCSIHDTFNSPVKIGTGFDTDANKLLQACQYGIIMNNRCVRGYDQGVSIWCSQYIEVFGNTVSDAGWGGCVMTNSDDCIIANNILRDNYFIIPGDNTSGHGCVVEGGSRNLISGNQILANNAYCIYLAISPLEWGVSGVTLNGAVVIGSTSIVVSSGTNFRVGATYMIRDGAASETVTVTNIATNTLTISQKTRFYHATGLAIGIRAAEENTVEANQLSGSVTNIGVKLSPAVRSNIRNNTIVRNYQKGLLVEQANGFSSGGTIIDGNYFSGNNTSAGVHQAILISNVDDTQVINNRISQNFTYVGIDVQGSVNCRIVGNSIYDAQSHGIYLENSGATICSKIIVANNDIKQCNGSGIKTDRANYINIVGNHCFANVGNGGFDLGGLTYSTVQGNLAMSNATNGILLLDSNSVASTNNVIQGNIVKDDGTGTKGVDGSALTQSVAIKEQDNGNQNLIIGNKVDVAPTKVGANTTIVKDNNQGMYNIYGDVNTDQDLDQGQLMIRGYANATQRLILGYDTTNNRGFISAGRSGVAWDNLILQVGGGVVGIGKDSLDSNAKLDVGGLIKFAGTNSTGGGSAALGANSPATTLTAPYTWLKALSSDGSNVYIPCWK